MTKGLKALSGLLLAGTMILSLSARAAEVKEVQMLHWWTSGGEAAALSVLKQDLAKQGSPGRMCRLRAAAVTPP